jgi:hypothetical protein
MPEELLNGADIIAIFQEMCGKRMAIMPSSALAA